MAVTAPAGLRPGSLLTSGVHLIGGEWVPAQASGTIDVINPATQELLLAVPRGQAADIDAAVRAAAAAFPAWRDRPGPRHRQHRGHQACRDAPLTCLLLAKLALQAGIPPGVLNVVTGTGPETGAALPAYPLVRRMSFTGSPETGSAIMTACARQAGGAGPQLSGHRRRGGRPARHRRPQAHRRRPRPGLLRRAHRLRPGEARHAHRAGGDLRPGPRGAHLRGRGRGARHRQRHQVRPERLRLDPRHRPRSGWPGACTRARSPSTVSAPAGVIGAPWGGYKHSGFGRTMSAESILDYTQIKTVVINA